MIEVPLTRGKIAFIDDEDAERVLALKWTYFFNKNNGKSYARRGFVHPSGKQGSTYLHRFIMNAPAGIQVDHRDNDGLNCQKENLRLATNAQNHGNLKTPSTNTTGFKGVYYAKPRLQPNGSIWTRRRPFNMVITANGKTTRIWGYATAEEAAKAYDTKARELFGEFARVNFPQEGEQSAHSHNGETNVNRT